MVEEIILVEPSENLIQLLFQSNTTSENETKYLDPNTAISISLVMLVTFTVNILAVVGVFKARITWMFPFLVLYMGFIIESGLALTFNLISNHVFLETKKNHNPCHTFSLSSRSNYVSFYMSHYIQHWMVLNENNSCGFGNWRDEREVKIIILLL